MKWGISKKAALFFVLLSLFMHIIAIEILFSKGASEPSRTSSQQTSLTVNLTRAGVTPKLNEVSLASPIVDLNQKDAGQTKSSGSDSLESNPKMTSGGRGWGFVKNNAPNSINLTEKDQMQARMGEQRMQRRSNLNSVIARLIGQLNQDHTEVSCAIWVNDDVSQGYITCSPKQYQERILMNLASTAIKWSQRSELSNSMCLSVNTMGTLNACQ